MAVGVSQAAASSNRVTYCHANDYKTGAQSAKNPVQDPYDQKETDDNGALAHSKTDTGPVFPARGPDGHWGDIIPPIPGVLPNGLNWNAAGIAIWDAGCKVVDSPEKAPPPTAPTTSPSTTTVPRATTTTATTTTTNTTTTAAGSTTTSSTSSTTTTMTVPTTTTTVAALTTTPLAVPTTAPPSELPPGDTDPTDGVEIVPPTQADVVDPGDTLEDVGQLDVPERVALEAELDAETATASSATSTTSKSLPATGGNQARLIAGGLMLLLAGLAVIMAAQTRANKK